MNKRLTAQIRQITIKFEELMKPRDLPAENVPFCVLREQQTLQNTFDFADSVVRKLARLQDLEEIVAEVEFEVAQERFIITLPPRTWRPDNVLVQACMAQKTFAGMGR